LVAKVARKPLIKSLAHAREFKLFFAVDP
jgi:hypothetical protein